MGKVINASGSGYFPFCFRPASDYQYPEYYITASLVDMMGVYWRVKTWRATISGGYSAIGEGSAFFNLIYSGSGDFDQPSSNPYPLKEEEIVCGKIREYFTNYSFTATISGPEYTVTENFNIFLSPFLLGFIKLSEDSIATSFLVESHQFGSVVGFSTEPGPPYLVDVLSDSIIEYKFLGKTIQTNKLWVRIPFSPYSQLKTNLKLILEPSEYWSYGGTYNTTTGQPL